MNHLVLTHKIAISYHFSCENHGKSICDSFFSLISRYLKSASTQVEIITTKMAIHVLEQKARNSTDFDESCNTNNDPIKTMDDLDCPIVIKLIRKETLMANTERWNTIVQFEKDPSFLIGGCFFFYSDYNNIIEEQDVEGNATKYKCYIS